MQTLHRIVQKLTDTSTIHSAASQFRLKRFALLIAFLDRIYKDRGKIDLVDLGGTFEYWNLLPVELIRKYRISITLVNLPGTFRKKEYPDYFRCIELDCCDLSCFSNNQFDLAHSNSVLEHVGSQSRMEKFIQEQLRVAHYFYLQTPDRKTPMEPHFFFPFFQYLPVTAQVYLVRNFDMGAFCRSRDIREAYRKVKSIHLLSEQNLETLLGRPVNFHERFCMMPKSLISYGKK